MQNSIKNDYLNCTLLELFRIKGVWGVEMMDEGEVESILMYKILRGYSRFLHYVPHLILRIKLWDRYY